MKQFRVGVLGATGMVGQRFVSLLAGHPWFTVTLVAASPRSAGQTYENAVRDRWVMSEPIPDNVKTLAVQNVADVKQIASAVDFVFCAVDMKKEEIKALEEAYAKAECPVISNNSAHRGVPDVPMIVPELNAHHAQVIPHQKKRLGAKRGFIAVKSNCSLQSYVPPLTPFLKDYGLEKVLVCTYQAISGAGKTFSSWPEMVDNVIPYIGGEEEKSQQEPLKIWGSVQNGVIVNAQKPDITAQCLRVPCADGHMAAVFVSFTKTPSMDDMKRTWSSWNPLTVSLPSAPTPFIRYFEEDDRPQTRLDRDNDNGMSISVGRLRPDSQYDYKFVCLSHNTLRGAAGGAVLMAELLAAEGYLD